MNTKTSEFRAVGRREDKKETKAIIGVLDRLREDGYIIGTNLMIDKEGDSWGVFDLEQNPLYLSREILSTAGRFVLMETPDVVLGLIQDDIVIIAEPPP